MPIAISNRPHAESEPLAPTIRPVLPAYRDSNASVTLTRLNSTGTVRNPIASSSERGRPDLYGALILTFANTMAKPEPRQRGGGEIETAATRPRRYCPHRRV